MTKIQSAKEKLIKFWITFALYTRNHDITVVVFFLLANFLEINIDTKVKYLLIKYIQWLLVFQMIACCVLATKLKNTDYPRMADRGTNVIHVTIHFRYDELDEHMIMASKKG